MAKADGMPRMAALALVAALGPFALNILVPSLPRIAEEFGVAYPAVQLALSLFLVGLAVSQLVYGPLSDRFGRRPLLLCGLMLFVAGSLIGLAAADVTILIIGRVVQAVGGCAGLVLARAMMRDLFQRDKAASMLAYMTMAMVAAPMLAPLLGGLLDSWIGWRAGFVVAAVVGTTALGSALVFLPETHRGRESQSGPAGALVDYARLLLSPSFVGYAGHAALSSAGFFAFLGGAPYVMARLLDRPSHEHGAYFVLAFFGYMVGNLVAGRWSVQVGSDRMVLFGMTITVAGAAALLGLTVTGAVTPLSLFLPMMVFAVGNGLSLPNALSGALSVDVRRAGAASGMAGFLQMGIGAVASSLAGHLLGDSAVPLAGIIFAFALASFLVFIPVVCCRQVVGERRPAIGSGGTELRRRPVEAE